LDILFRTAEVQVKKAGPFDFLLVVGQFLPKPEDDAGKQQADLYLSGQKSIPLPTFFIDAGSEDLATNHPDGVELATNLHYLGRRGVNVIDGLRVVYLSGCSTGDGSIGIGEEDVSTLVKGIKQCAGKVDLLVTAEWPSGITGKLMPDCLPQLEADVLKQSSSDLIADLAVRIEARYHVASSAATFFARPPFQAVKHGHICRFVGLGPVGSKEKHRKWLHALKLVPASEMTPEVLRYRPADTTPCPLKAPEGFVPQGGVAAESSSADPGQSAPNGDNAGQESDSVFINGLPSNVDEPSLRKVMNRFGTIQFMKVMKNSEGQASGNAIVRFARVEEAKEAVKGCTDLVVGRRKIWVRFDRNKRDKDPDGQPVAKKPKIDLAPHAGCWFCFANPNVEKHLIVSASAHAYVALAKGGIDRLHCMVLPTKHLPCFAQAPDDVQAAIHENVAKVSALFREADMDYALFERWIPMRNTQANHMQLHVVPVPQSRSSAARETLEESVKKAGLTLKRIERISHLEEAVGDANYWYFAVPGDNSARGRTLEHYVVLGGRLPLNMGREIVCDLLGCSEKVDWRECQLTEEQETKAANVLRQTMKQLG